MDPESNRASDDFPRSTQGSRGRILRSVYEGLSERTVPPKNIFLIVFWKGKSNEAIILMVESNLQRSKILPSEKAFSYKMRLEAIKRQAGRPSKENSRPVVDNSDERRSGEIIGDAVGESERQIERSWL